MTFIWYNSLNRFVFKCCSRCAVAWAGSQGCSQVGLCPVLRELGLCGAPGLGNPLSPAENRAGERFLPGWHHPPCQENVGTGMGEGGRADPLIPFSTRWSVPVFLDFSLWDVSLCTEQEFPIPVCCKLPVCAVHGTGQTGEDQSPILGCSAPCGMECQLRWGPGQGETLGVFQEGLEGFGAARGSGRCPWPRVEMGSKVPSNPICYSMIPQLPLPWNSTPRGSLEKRSTNLNMRHCCCGILIFITARMTWEKV